MPLISRRTWLGGSLYASLAAASGVRAATPLQSSPVRIPVWPGAAPGGSRVTVTAAEIPRSADGPPNDTAFVHVREPVLIHTPAVVPNGAALLNIPGGGYRRVAVGLGGMAFANHFARLGFAVYTLIYRLPADGWEAGPDAPLQDAQRALRLIRFRAGQDGFDPSRIGVIGGSAGGHLAARLVLRQDISSYKPSDAIDRLPLAPKVAGLLFPVVATTGSHAHRGSVEELFPKATDAAAMQSYSADAAIAAGSPPTFLAHAIDDTVVRWRNSALLMDKLALAGVPQEAHFFERGGHGFGLDGPAARWVDLFMDFARRHALI